MLRWVFCPFTTCRSHALGSNHRRSTWRIGFRIVMELNNFCSLKIRCGLFCEFHHENCANGKVRGNETTTTCE